VTRDELRRELLDGIDRLLHSRAAALAMTETQEKILRAEAKLYRHDDETLDRLLAVVNQTKGP
jgi:hypothetical protein